MRREAVEGGQPTNHVERAGSKMVLVNGKVEGDEAVLVLLLERK